MRSVTHEKAGEPAQGEDPNGTLLQVRGLCASYGKHRVLSGVDLDVRRGEFLGLLGHNGAGKTTLLRCVLGLMAPTAGAIRVEGKDIGGHSPAAVVARGISMVPQGDTVFPRLTVQEHLRLSSRRRGGGSTWDVVFDLFPILKERRHRPAGEMSGGQRQMLAIGCALAQEPKVMLLDEPSTGLAPVLVDQVLDAIARINADLGTSVIVVEQDAPRLMRYCDRLQVIKLGTTVFQGTTDELRARDWLELF